MSFHLPAPTPETQPFWVATAEGRLKLTYCLDTEQFFFYPRRFSPFTGTQNVEWREVSGEGTLHSYIINARPLPGTTVLSPIIALVKLAEGPVLMSNIVEVDPDPENLKIDMKLVVDFRDVGGIHLPVFKPKEINV